MRRCLAPFLFVCATLTAQQAPIPMADALGGRPYAIVKTWVIGGTGNWDSLTIDPVANQLFIAHGPAVQVVDVGAGTVAGTVEGFREAHAIALDDEGQFGYATDGPADKVRVFDRRTFQVVASIATGPRPRAVVIEPQTGLLLAICAEQSPTGDSNAPADNAPRTNSTSRRPANRPGTSPPSNPPPSASTITVIDIETRQPLINLTMRGRLGLAQADGDGHVYVTVEDRNQVARLDAVAIAALARAPHKEADGQQSAEFQPVYLRLPAECHDPRSLAVDGKHQRLFVACNNMKMSVLNAGGGQAIASLTIGPGAQAIGYDAGRGLIFTANGGGYGSVTIIRQDVTDSYSVLQNVPTREQARTLAVNPSTGEVYLVTALYAAKLDHPPANGIGTLKMNPVDSSFQVLVIGN